MLVNPAAWTAAADNKGYHGRRLGMLWDILKVLIKPDHLQGTFDQKEMPAAAS